MLSDQGPDVQNLMVVSYHGIKISILKYGKYIDSFAIFFFLFGFYGPFKNISHIEPIVHQRWAKTGKPREKPPDHP